MTDLIVGNAFARAIGLALVDFVWQGAILGTVAGALLIALHHRSAQARYLIACLALSGLMAVPLISVTRYLPARQPRALDAGVPSLSSDRASASTLAPMLSRASGESNQNREPVGHSWWPRSERQLGVIVLLWAVGVVVLTIRLAGAWALVRRIQRCATDAVGEPWSSRLATLKVKFRVTHPVRLVRTALVTVPTIVGCIRPIILMPIGAFAGLSVEQLEAVLAHELAHIRRHDYFVNILQSVVETLLFFHPAVWWISRRIRIEREHCCDDLALAACGDRRQYATALLHLAELGADSPALAVAVTGGDLTHRIGRVLGLPVSKGSRVSGPAVTCALLALFSLATMTRVHGTQTRHIQAAPPAQVTFEIQAPTKAPAASFLPVRTNAPSTAQPVLTAAKTAERSPSQAVTAESAVLQAEERFRVAKLANDINTLERLFDDAFIETNQNGNTRDKQGALELWKTFHITSLVINSAIVKVAEHTATVTGRMTEVNVTGTDRMLFTRVWKESAPGTWRLLSCSQFRDPQPDPAHYSAESKAAISPAVMPSSTEMQISHRLPAFTQMSVVTPATSGQRRELPPAHVRSPQGIVWPSKIVDVAPVYPQTARGANAEGTATILAVINDRGDVTEASVLDSPYGLGDVALDAVKQWRYQPGLLDGAPVAFPATITVKFALQQEQSRPPAATDAQVYEPGKDGVSLPRVISRVDPEYPTAAMTAKIEGIVILKIVIQPDGHADHITVTKSLDNRYGLDDEAVKATEQWLFEPARKDGNPVAVWAQVELEFRLRPPRRGGD